MFVLSHCTLRFGSEHPNCGESEVLVARHAFICLPVLLFSFAFLLLMNSCGFSAAFADRMFQTNQGPNFPAHQFILSGTSAPTATSNLFASDNPNIAEGGCTLPADTTVPLIDPQGAYAGPMYPCSNTLHSPTS
jgi:hypothetical protein